MALWSKRERQPVATVEIAFLDDKRAAVTDWVQADDRDVASYHRILHFMMYYARLLFFLSFRPAAEELVGWMDEAVRALAAAEEGAAVSVSQRWLLADAAEGETRAVWSSALLLLGAGEYKCTDKRPENPEDADAQGAALLYLQRLVDTMPTLERAYLALGITGMHEYYRDIQHWNTSKSLHPAPAYGMSHARKILHG